MGNERWIKERIPTELAGLRRYREVAIGSRRFTRWLAARGLLCGSWMVFAVAAGLARLGEAQEGQGGENRQVKASERGLRASDGVTASTVGVLRVESMRGVVLRWRSALQLSDRARQVWGRWVRSRAERDEASLVHPAPATGWDWEDIEAHAGAGWVFGFLDAAGHVQNVSWLEFENAAKQQEFRSRWLDRRGGEQGFKSWVAGGQADGDEGSRVRGWESVEHARGALAVVGDGIVVSHSGDVLRTWLESVEANRLGARGEVESGVSAGGVSEGKAGGVAGVVHVLGEGDWGQSGEERPIRFWCSPQRWLDGQSSGEAEALEGGMFGKGTRASRWLAKAKLWEADSVRSLSGSVYWDAEQREWVVTYRGVLRMPLSGAWRLLELESREWSGIPEWVRREADGWSLTWIDRQPWFEGLRSAMDRIIDPTQPGIFDDVLDSLLTDPDGPKINIRRELIDHLGPQLLHAQRHVRQVDGGIDARSMWLIEVQDPRSATQAFERFFDGDDAVKREEQGAGTLWIADPGESILFAIGSEDAGAYHCMGIRGSAWWIANDIEWLRQVWRESEVLKEADAPSERLAGSGEGEGSVPWSWELGGDEAASSESALYQAEDWSRSLESAWRAAERGVPEAILKSAGAGAMQLRWLQDWVLGQGLEGGMFDSRLPEWEDIRESLGGWTHQLQREEGGVRGELRWRRAVGK